MNYEEMSDYEINRAVAAHLIPCGYDPDDKKQIVELLESFDKPEGETHNGIGFDYRVCGTFDPCNSPSDAWPIIVENKISIKFRSGTDKLSCMAEYDNQTYSVHENPLRAAMIVYLIMQEAE